MRSPLRLVQGLADTVRRDRLRDLAIGLMCALGGAGALGAGLWSATTLTWPGTAGHDRAGTVFQRGPALASATATGFAGRLRIPAIDVDAAIESVGLDQHGNMATPAVPQDVGWYRYGPLPGDQGDAVVDGHLDWTIGPAVFWKLDRLRPGDDIVVELPGRAPAHFQVASLTNVPYNAHPAGLFATSGPPRLSLITCSGPFDFLHQNYLERLIVAAGRVGLRGDLSRWSAARSGRGRDAAGFESTPGATG